MDFSKNLNGILTRTKRPLPGSGLYKTVGLINFLYAFLTFLSIQKVTKLHPRGAPQPLEGAQTPKISKKSNGLRPRTYVENLKSIGPKTKKCPQGAPQPKKFQKSPMVLGQEPMFKI